MLRGELRTIGRAVTPLHVLLVDDDQESLNLLATSLPSEVANHTVTWEACNDFDDAIQRVQVRRYDVVVTDVYRDRTSETKTPVTGDPRAGDIVASIRGHRFSPILLFTDGTFPLEYEEGPFLKLADKSRGNDAIVEKLSELLETGIPELARRLHDDLDRTSGSYVWGFLEDNWRSLEQDGLTSLPVLERLLRRRAATQLGRLDPEGGAELETVEGAEFYLHPPISDELRLGEIIVSAEDDYRVVLTPHCHLTVQQGAMAPRAEFVLTLRTLDARTLFADEPVGGNTREKRLEELRRRIQSPAGFGKPAGRYWFLPGLLEMGHRFADFLQLESLPYERIRAEYRPFAVLDIPFAEALQSCFVRFYSAVGLPILQPERFEDLLE